MFHQSCFTIRWTSCISARTRTLGKKRRRRNANHRRTPFSLTGRSKGVDRGKTSPVRRNGSRMTVLKTMGRMAKLDPQNGRRLLLLEGTPLWTQKVCLPQSLPPGNAGGLRSGSRKTSLPLHQLRGNGVDRQRTAPQPPRQDQRLRQQPPLRSPLKEPSRGLLAIRGDHPHCHIQKSLSVRFNREILPKPTPCTLLVSRNQPRRPRLSCLSLGNLWKGANGVPPGCVTRGPA